jgi:hypothetical protein
LLTLLPAFKRRVGANTSSLSVLRSSKGLGGLAEVASTFPVSFRIRKNAKFFFSCVSASL